MMIDLIRQLGIHLSLNNHLPHTQPELPGFRLEFLGRLRRELPLLQKFVVQLFLEVDVFLLN
jgi:hypothetical protein